MPSIGDYLNIWERLESASLSVHQERCVEVRNRNAGCLRCAKACTSGCISYADNVLEVAPEKCIGCGTCATVCPTGALEPREPDDAQLFEACLRAMDANGGQLVFACERLLEAAAGKVDPRKVVGLTCLGRVDESLIVNAIDAGATRVTLVKGACATCPHIRGAYVAGVVVKTAAELLETWRNGTPVALKGKLPASTRLRSEDHDVERRGFLENMKGSAKSAAALTGRYARDSLSGAPTRTSDSGRASEVGAFSHRLPERRCRLVNGLRELGEPSGACVRTHLWGRVVIDAQRCRSCYLCAAFCPTGALQKIDEEDFAGIAHRNAACVGCGCCERICPAQALELKAAVSSDDIATGRLERIALRREEHPEDDPDAMFQALGALMDLGVSREA